MKITKELISKVLELNKQGLTYKEIQKELNLSSIRGVRYYIKKNNIEFKNNQKHPKKYESIDDYFSVIDTHNKAYILGFTYADGCVYDNKRFGYCISEKDVEIINFIKKEISKESPIKKIHNTKGAKNRLPQVVLRIGNKKLVSDLINKWGVVPNKTLNPKLVFPNIETDLIWSFIRGLFDGDGHIALKNKSYLQMSICMTDLYFLKQVQQFLMKNNIISTVSKTKGKTCNYYRLACWKTKEAAKFFEKIYSNSEFSLERKKQIFGKYRAN